MSHTPEPWKTVSRGDEYADDIDAFKGEGWNADVTIAMNIGTANARRIVACVNACSNLPTDWLEKNSLTDCTSSHFLTKQRDDLLATLELLICTRNNEAKTAMALNNAAVNFSSSKAEEAAWEKATVAASQAEKAAMKIIASMKGAAS